MSELFKPLTSGPPIAPTAIAPAGAVGTATASLATLPPTLAELTAGTVIAGVVVERSRGMVMIKTDKGMLQMQTGVPLKLGAAVVLEVQSVGAQVRLAILSVDQHVPAAPAEPPSTAASTAAAERESATAAPIARATAPIVGRTFTTTVVGAPDPRLADASDPTIPTLLRRLIAISAVVRAAANATPGTVIADSVTPGNATPRHATPSGAPPSPPAGMTWPEPSAGTPAAPNTPPTPHGSAPAPASPQPSSPQPESLVIPTAEELEVALKTLPPPAREIVAALLADVASTEQPRAPFGATASHVAPATAPAAESPTAASSRDVVPRTIAIRILALSAPGDLVATARPHIATASDAITLVGTAVADETGAIDLATPIGRLRLRGPVVLPDGTRVTFEVLSRTADTRTPPSSTALLDAGAMPPAVADHEWPAARELATRWPEAADALLPKAGQPLGPSILAFLAAAQRGAAKAWLGARLADAETPDRKDIVTRTGQELATHARTTVATERDTWQTFAVPVIDGGRISELRFRFRKREQRDDDSDERSDRRFVVQATLSVLGPLRLDGTVRDRHLDLVVRTARPLPPAMRHDMSAVFARALETTSYRGDIRFQNDLAGDSAAPGTGNGSGMVV